LHPRPRGGVSAAPDAPQAPGFQTPPHPPRVRRLPPPPPPAARARRGSVADVPDPELLSRKRSAAREPAAVRLRHQARAGAQELASPVAASASLAEARLAGTRDRAEFCNDPR